MLFLTLARQTGEHWQKAFLFSNDIIQETKRRYLASWEKIGRRVQPVPGHGQEVVFLGHNPGLEDLAAELAGVLLDVPAPARACFPCRAASWQKASRDAFECDFRISPKASSDG